MSPLFTINFRREAYLKELARARRRVFALAIWVAYFGAMGVLMGLYGLNCVSTAQRLRQMERQTARLRGAHGATLEWKFNEAELGEIERYVTSPRVWHDRLVGLAGALPSNARITTIALNPRNLSGPEANVLVISGQLRAAAGQELMPSVMRAVATLRSDSLFAAHYSAIRLASTRVPEGNPDLAEFEIECR